MTRKMLEMISNITDQGDLQMLKEAIKDQERILSHKTAMVLLPGDTIKFVNEIRPRYLAGLTATVVKKNRESITVKCPQDHAYGKFSGLGKVRLPLSLIAGKV